MGDEEQNTKKHLVFSKETLHSAENSARKNFWSERINGCMRKNTKTKIRLRHFSEEEDR